uniref:MH1 domain-containing protein n=1 Tax=Glossina brevipalpis TaxID=37001 RepID=A0A1A9W590_9MUSC
MKFQSEKKELWRYASKNLQGPVGGTRKSPLLHRLQHQRLPQLGQKGNQNQLSNNVYANASGEARSISTPPPPYSSIPELNISKISMDGYQDNNLQNHSSVIDGDADMSMSATESEMNCSQMCTISKDGYNIVNTGDIMLGNNYENLNEISTGSSSVYLPPSEQQKKLRRHISPIKKSIGCDCSPSSQTISTTTTNNNNNNSSTTTGLFAATAAKILRNCCGGGFGSTNSESIANSSDNNNTSCNKNRTIEMQTDVSHPLKSQPPEQYFNALMKQLKASQITLLLKAVKARHEPVEFLQSTLGSTSRNTVHTFQTNCILTQRGLILGEEPYLIACRLFLWRDLKRSSELKRLPACPNECDPVYVCCNPLHWCRILETDQVSYDLATNQLSDSMSHKNVCMYMFLYIYTHGILEIYAPVIMNTYMFTCISKHVSLLSSFIMLSLLISDLFLEYEYENKPVQCLHNPRDRWINKLTIFLFTSKGWRRPDPVICIHIFYQSTDTN